MKHNIIVKYNESVSDKGAMLAEIKALFASAGEIEGVSGAEAVPNCIDRENRYDVMITVTMEKDALPNWDESALHKRWLSEYGGIVAKKAIFDCE